ncbi:MAG: hypothetical protein EBU67_07605 [Actinobacteria bacterium]|jgi:hypothetical protein|nr:hypothetical protein [Actinomycetota bacterium]
MSPFNRGGLGANPQSIPFDEWWRMWHFVNAFEARDSVYFRVWLEVAGGCRTWHISSPRFHFEVCTLVEGTSGTFTVPVPVRVIHAMTDIATTSFDTTLALADHDTLTVTADDACLVYDIPSFNPGTSFVLDSVDCTAVVSAKRLADVLDAARTPPIGLDIVGYGPPLWCVIGDGKITFHSDWSSYDHGRATVSIEARTNGEAQFHSGVSVVARVLRDFTSMDDGDDTVTLEVDGPTGLGCRVVGSDWVLTCPFIDPVAQEWGSAMRRELMSVGIEYQRDGERAVEYLVDGVQVRAQVHGGRHPVCRLSATVARNVGNSEFLLGELNDWNMSHAGMKFWWESEKVVAVVDLDSRHMSDICDESSRLAAVVTRLAAPTTAL